MLRINFRKSNTYFRVLHSVQESCGLNLCLLDLGGNDLVLGSPVVLPFIDGAVVGGGSDIVTFREFEMEQRRRYLEERHSFLLAEG